MSDTTLPDDSYELVLKAMKALEEEIVNLTSEEERNKVRNRYWELQKVFDSIQHNI